MAINKDNTGGTYFNYKAQKAHEELLGKKGKALTDKEKKALGEAVNSKQWWKNESN